MITSLIKMESNIAETGQFAMRHPLILFLGFCLWAAPVFAQSSDALLYEVTDVAVDVTADSAAHARDQAVGQAQSQAFSQLLERLDADPSLATKLKPDDLSTLVQNFEVQNERASSVRYIGTFTVQFRPTAVRSYLASHGTTLAVARSKPFVVLPIYMSNGHPILWEEATRWRTMWDKTGHNDGLVPILVPSGGIDDISLISTDEAVNGKSDPIKALIIKYQAGGAAIALLNGSLDNPTAGFSVDLTIYDVDGDASAPTHLVLPPVSDKSGIEVGLLQGIKLARRQLEKDWKGEAKQEPQAAADTSDDTTTTTPATTTYDGPILHVPVIVPISTLAEWALVRQKLIKTPGISRVDVLALQRGTANVELELRGSLLDVQATLIQEHLQLSQDLLNNTWTLRPI